MNETQLATETSDERLPDRGQRSLRSSGIPWLPEVAENWMISPLRHRYTVDLGKMLDEKKMTGDHLVPYLRNRDVQWDEVRTDDLPLIDIEPRERARYTVEAGDLLICEGGEVGRSGFYEGGLAVCGYQKALHRVRPLRRDRDNPRYLYYLLVAASRAGAFEADGDMSTISHLTAEKLRAHRFPFPDRAEQDAIADLLDRRTSALDAVLDTNARRIESLWVHRNGEVHRAISGGYSTSRRRPVNLPWLDRIPEPWDAARLHLLARLESGHTPSRSRPEYWEPNECVVPWFTLSDVWQLRDGQREYLGKTEECVSERGLANSAARRLPAGTVVLSRTASVGFSGIMPLEMATTQDFANWVCGEHVIPEYLLYVLRAMKYRGEFERLMAGSTHQTIYMPAIRKLAIPVPPVSEQHEIVDRLRTRLAPIDRAINKAAEQGERLHEYRFSLIWSAILGQLISTAPARAAS